MSDTRVLTESLGGSPLSRAGRAGQLPQWFVARPRSVDAWKGYAGDVITSVHADWLDQLAPAFAAGGAAADRLQRSAGGKGLVVTTGQQPGLFGGPLMTFAKALSARALADVLQETTGLPVAPVFWAATDDADFDETATVSVSLDGGARSLTLTERPQAGTPVARVPMGDEVDVLAQWLREACGSAAHASYLECALAAYQKGATIGDAYVTLLRTMLEPLGIAVLDVSHPAVTAASLPVMRRAARDATRVAAAVNARNDAITSAGYAPQVDEVPGLSLVFVNDTETGIKRRLTQVEAEQFQVSHEQWLSSTVLLRPVLERALLPTAAYVAGPGEFAYFAQVTAVAEALHLSKPLAVPRWSTTLLEPRLERLLVDLGASREELADPHALEARLARERIPQGLQGAVANLRTSTRDAIERLANVPDSVLAQEVVQGLKRDIEHRVDRLERRTLAGVKRREGELMRRIATAHGALYPHGIRQERELAWIPFLVRGGQPLVDVMIAAATIHARALVASERAVSAQAASTAHV